MRSYTEPHKCSNCILIREFNQLGFMAITPKIKICGITRLEDASLALELGADYLGCILYPKSPRAVSWEQARAFCRHVPPGKRVFVDVNTGTDELEDYADLGFDYFQIHFDGDCSLASLAGWSGIVGAPALWMAPRIPPTEPFPQDILQFADTLLIDTYHGGGYGGTGQTGDWQRFCEWSTLYQHKTWILAGGLTPDNAVEAYRSTQAPVLDFNSGLESAPGLKDPAKMKALFAALRVCQ